MENSKKILKVFSSNCKKIRKAQLDNLLKEKDELFKSAVSHVKSAKNQEEVNTIIEKYKYFVLLLEQRNNIKMRKKLELETMEFLRALYAKIKLEIIERGSFATAINTAKDIEQLQNISTLNYSRLDEIAKKVKERKLEFNVEHNEAGELEDLLNEIRDML